jgi:hypothetical protein
VLVLSLGLCNNAKSIYGKSADKTYVANSGVVLRFVGTYKPITDGILHAYHQVLSLDFYLVVVDDL